MITIETKEEIMDFLNQVIEGKKKIPYEMVIVRHKAYLSHYRLLKRQYLGENEHRYWLYPLYPPDFPEKPKRLQIETIESNDYFVSGTSDWGAFPITEIWANDFEDLPTTMFNKEIFMRVYMKLHETMKFSAERIDSLKRDNAKKDQYIKDDMLVIQEKMKIIGGLVASVRGDKPIEKEEDETKL